MPTSDPKDAASLGVAAARRIRVVNLSGDGSPLLAGGVGNIEPQPGSAQLDLPVVTGDLGPVLNFFRRIGRLALGAQYRRCQELGVWHRARAFEQCKCFSHGRQLALGPRAGPWRLSAQSSHIGRQRVHREE